MNGFQNRLYQELRRKARELTERAMHENEVIKFKIVNEFGQSIVALNDRLQ